MKLDRIDNYFISVSLHEGAHAVVAHKLGLTVRDISVEVKEDDYSGKVNVDDLEDRDERSAIVYAAGEAAMWEHMQSNKSRRAKAFLEGKDMSDVWALYPDSSTEDIAGVRRYLDANYFSGATRKREAGRIKAEARRLVREYWNDIADVAAALNLASVENSMTINAKLTRSQFLAALEGKTTASGTGTTERRDSGRQPALGSQRASRPDDAELGEWERRTRTFVPVVR